MAGAGSLQKMADAILLPYFLIISVITPLFDSQTCLPPHLYPQPLLNLTSWYVREYGDYFLVEKPPFFLGAVWLEIFFQWPLAIASVFGIIGRKSWYGTTCLMYGVSTCSGMAPILADMIISGKASDKLWKMYLPFFVLSLVAILRGLLPPSSSSSHVKAAARKKRA